MTARRGASGAASALLFFALPLAMIVVAVGLRGSGAVESATTIVGRLRGHLAAARAAADAEGVPLALVLAVAAAESGGHADARSPRGALGLMQLMPGTAEEMARRGREPPPNILDPTVSLRLGARYLALQRRRFRDLPHADELALCAYNAGPSRVSSWLRESPPEPGRAILGSWIPYPETRDYVRRVMAWRMRGFEFLAGPPAEPAD